MQCEEIHRDLENIAGPGLHSNDINCGIHHGELAFGYSSDREEGEITRLKGKEKAHDSEVDIVSDTRKLNNMEVKLVRKSQ